MMRLSTTALLLVLSANVFDVAAYDAQPPDCSALGLGEEYIHPGEDVLVSICETSFPSLYPVSPSISLSLRSIISMERPERS
jgi:hypothetical protein